MSPFSDDQYNMIIQLDAKECRLTDEQLNQIDKAIEPLDRMVARFPKPELHITVSYHQRSRSYHVKTSLILASDILFTGGRAEDFYAPFVQCIRKLMHKLGALESEMSGQSEKNKQVSGHHHVVLPDWQPDPEEVRRAIEQRNYLAFRESLYGYEEPIRKRAGRWVQRNPDAQAIVGDSLKLGDVVEEVMLNAFDHFEEKPTDVRLGQWLEGWIDPSISALVQAPDEENENIRFVQSWQEARNEAIRQGGG